MESLLSQEEILRTCFFTGHREIPRCRAEELRLATRRAAEELITRRGVHTFLCGGAVGYDRLAAEEMFSFREETGADIRIYLVFPFRENRPGASTRGFSGVEGLWDKFDRIYYAAEHYFNGVFYKRDRLMADNAAFCIAWLEKTRGGTYYTVSYAYDKNIELTFLSPGKTPPEGISSGGK